MKSRMKTTVRSKVRNDSGKYTVVVTTVDGAAVGLLTRNVKFAQLIQCANMEQSFRCRKNRRRKEPK